MKLTREEWEAKGRELFGEDQSKWRFVCPACGREASMASTRDDHVDALPRLRERNYRIEQECIGRHLPGVGCNWAAYGLFRGPLFVDGLACFDFAGKPFTASRPIEGGES
jgi:hypothetical protein